MVAIPATRPAWTDENQHEGDERDQRADQEGDAHEEAIHHRIAEGRAGKAVELLFGGVEEDVLGGAEELDDAIGGLAGEALFAERLDEAFLDDVGLFLGFAADAIELAAEDGGFGVGAEIGPGTHRERAGDGRGERGENHLRADGDGTAQTGEDAGGGQHAVLECRRRFHGYCRAVRNCADTLSV